MTWPFVVLLEALEHRTRFEVRGDKLHVIPAQGLPSEFVDALRDCKPQLLSLVALPFVMVDSKAVGKLLFFCQDDNTKAALVRAGADPSSIYTKAELRILVAQNRIKPLTQAELRKVHDIKRTFGAKINTE